MNQGSFGYAVKAVRYGLFVPVPFALVDAFVTEKPFSGNPAGVVLLEKWPANETLPGIAAEMNQAETAFLVPNGSQYELRWFTPTVEVTLCGHATLASAAALSMWNNEVPSQSYEFTSASGLLTCSSVDGQSWTLNFPVAPVEESRLPDCLDFVTKQSTWTGHYGDDWLAEFESETDIVSFVPDFGLIRQAAKRGLVITARSGEDEFVYRFFAPQSGVDEDHATGSAQTGLLPFWVSRGSTSKLRSRQLSPRGAGFTSEIDGDRVRITGQTRLVVSGTLYDH